MGADETIASIATRQHGAVGWFQLRDAGVDRRLVSRRCGAGSLRWVTPRVLVVAGAPCTPEQRLMIAVLDTGHGGLASHGAAAWLWRLPGFGPTDDVIRPRDRHLGARATIAHRPRLPPLAHGTEVRGIPCTTLPRTMFDLAGSGMHGARMQQLVNVVVTQSPAMLPALHRMLDELACRGRTGITLMRDVLAENPVGSVVTASGLENRVLQLARRAGIHDLEPQVDVGGHSWLGRVDFAVLRLKLLIEVDSVIHHSSPMDVARDQARDVAMLAAGWGMVLRIREEDVWRRPDLVVQQLRAAVHELEAVLGTASGH